MARTQLCQAMDGTKVRVFRASAVMYTAGTKDVLGVSPVEETNANDPVYDTGELMRTGLLVRLAVQCNNGTTKPPITYRLFCTKEKINEALTYYNSNGRTLNGKSVMNAGFERRLVIK
ncbi:MULTISPECIES: hypothetical protein [Limnospira]|uniref:hypothetical protein n=1 Tax=Limnospira TaxID=2596745 RepID=UPI0014498F0F|nr:hypothetical protein [Limnospira sp. PMC 1042.18]MDT9200224.1 hypothetical protein [Limnospira sp. PMC 1042.18]QJB24623.1 hypothetical protein HFV01_00995 [Limnospira fusiformis SAG 85.79]